ncbi:MAG: pyridoxamine 5'-phosphate oxidase family protein, partial [Eubacterium sp.]|nr:pyridoxamine 5'-phosphate oxidase family protein [Eubacterium sp.]
MFREMRRSPQALSHEEMIDLLKTETRGVMSVQGDDGYPYGFPINHYYDEEANRIYIHGANFGHRVDAVRRDPKVSYCVFG